jgi:hypothetical protein
MKLFALNLALFCCQLGLAQKNGSIRFKNDYQDVYHLALIIYTPEGKGQTRVSNLQPGEQKEYVFPIGTEIFVADRKQEAFAMKGNDTKAAGAKPTLTINGATPLTVVLSSLATTGTKLKQ